MLGIWFRGGISKFHAHKRCDGRVAVLQALKEGSPETVFWILGDRGNRYSIALHDEISQTTFQIGFRLPRDHVIFNLYMGGGWRRSGVSYFRVFHVLHP